MTGPERVQADPRAPKDDTRGPGRGQGKLGGKENPKGGNGIADGIGPCRSLQLLKFLLYPDYRINPPITKSTDTVCAFQKLVFMI